MSYCVNCGVELDDNEKSCPLCHIPVQNPVKPWREPTVTAYPKRVEYILKGVNRRYGAILATILLAIPVICCVLIDWLITRSVSWSGYVSGGCVCAFIWFLLPNILKKKNVYLQILYDTVAALLYLADIFVINDLMGSYFTLALPLALACCALTYAATPILRSKALEGNLTKYSLLSFLLAIFLIAVEIIIDLYVAGRLDLIWSPIATVPLVVIGALLMILEKRKKVKDKIIRRLFV